MFNRASKILATLAATTALAGTATAQEMPGEGVTVRPVVGLIAEEYFQSRILFQALADLGYEVAEPLETEIQTAHLAVGTGDADFYPIHWGTLHQAFFDESGGEDVLERVGPFVEGMVQGYLIDKASYEAGVTDIADLQDSEVAARFDGDGDGIADALTGAGAAPGCTTGGGGGSGAGSGLGTGIGMSCGAGSRVILGNSIDSAGPTSVGSAGSVISGHGSVHGFAGGSCDGIRTGGSSADSGSGTGTMRGYGSGMPIRSGMRSRGSNGAGDGVGGRSDSQPELGNARGAGGVAGATAGVTQNVATARPTHTLNTPTERVHDVICPPEPTAGQRECNTGHISPGGTRTRRLTRVGYKERAMISFMISLVPA